MPDDEGDAGHTTPEIALESARRVYDKRVRRLEAIDDKAMRSARSGVLILGFIAAGLTSLSPATVANTPLLPVVAGALGTLLVAASAFACVGIYTVTQVPSELSKGDLDTTPRPEERLWYEVVMDRLETAVERTGEEIRRNRTYFEYSQVMLVSGSGLLVYATGVTVVADAFGVSVAQQTLAVAVLVILAGLLRGAQLSISG